jgi:hypothetical protein
MAVSEKTFHALVQDRLVDTDQVREMLGLRTSAGVMHRVEKGHYSGPILVRDKGYSLWDKLQVEREEKARIKKLATAKPERKPRRVRTLA